MDSSSSHLTDVGSRPQTEGPPIYFSFTVDLETADQSSQPDLALPYCVTIATRLTQEQIQNLDKETACTLACLRETPYYWKDQRLYLKYGGTGYCGIEPMPGFLDRIRDLASKSPNVVLLNDDDMQFMVPEDSLPENTYQYRRVLGEEIEELETKLTDSITATTLEFGPDRPPMPDILNTPENRVDSTSLATTHGL